MSEYYIAFWNLENLFDTFDAPDRPAWLQKALTKELAGWTGQVLSRKVQQLAQVIQSLNGGLGPDLLGVCEVENQRVLEQLVQALAPLGRNYAIAHHDTADQRGIDVAFIYDRAHFTAQEQFFHVILKRAATRDLFQVNFLTQSGLALIAIANHWPSRSGGQFESEPYRITAAETLSYWASRILEIKGRDVAIVAMGDFNDEPFNRSIMDYALAGNNRAKVLNAQTPRFLNLMWPFLGQGIGTHYYDNFPNVLDQFWVSRGLITGAGGFRVKSDSVKIERFGPMVSPGDYGGPRRFGRPSEKLDETGFSDHYPISVTLNEV